MGINVLDGKGGVKQKGVVSLGHYQKGNDIFGVDGFLIIEVY
jgi:hypothetical protein